MQSCSKLENVLVFLLVIVSTAMIDSVYFQPPESVILKCPQAKHNSAVTWMFNMKIYWTGNELNTLLKDHARFEVIGNFKKGEYNLKIVNTTFNDEGYYTCLHNMPPSKFRILLQIEDSTSHQSEVMTETTVGQEINTKLERKDILPTPIIINGIPPKELAVYSILAIAVLLLIISFSCWYKMYKHPNTVVHVNEINSNLQSSLGNERTELNGMPHVYHLIDENEMDELNDADAGPEMQEIHYGETSGLQLSGHLNEYLHPYSSLLDTTEPENHSYEKPLGHYNGFTYYKETQIDDIQRLSCYHPVHVSNVGYMGFSKDQNNRTNKIEGEISKSTNTSIKTITNDMNTMDDNISLD